MNTYNCFHASSKPNEPAYTRKYHSYSRSAAGPGRWALLGRGPPPPCAAAGGEGWRQASSLPHRVPPLPRRSAGGRGVGAPAQVVCGAGALGNAAWAGSGPRSRGRDRTAARVIGRYRRAVAPRSAAVRARPAASPALRSRAGAAATNRNDALVRVEHCAPDCGFCPIAKALTCYDASRY